jgi:hypothetical protein
MIGNMVTVFSPGKMEENMRVTGRMVNRMVVVSSQFKEVIRKREFGRTEKEYSG